MEYGSGGVECLKLVLNVKSLKDVSRAVNGKVRAVGVVRSVSCLACSHDVGIVLLVVLCETIACRLRRCSLKVVEIAILYLIILKTLSHVVECLLCEFLCALVVKIASDPLGIEAALVHTDQTNGREMVTEGSEISLCVRIKSLGKELCDDITLNLERTCGDVHHAVETLEELVFVSGKICDPRHVDGNNADGTGALARSEETAGLLPELTKIETESAAHRSYIRRLHVGIDIV